MDARNPGRRVHLTLPEIGVELPLAELYEGIVFDDGLDAGQSSQGEPA